MNLLYRVLGWAAYINERQSHTNINFIPFNWVLSAIAYVFGVTGTINTITFFMTGVAHRGENPIFSIVTMLVGGVAAALLTATFFMKYIVFQKTGVLDLANTGAATAIASGTEDKDRVIGFTGELRLDEKTAQRFLDVPAVAQSVESGELAFTSNIDASSTFYGQMILKQRVGIWYSLLRSGTLSKVEEGVLYLGKKERPSLRMSYTEGVTNSAVTSIISFDDENQRADMVDKLRTAKSPQRVA